MTDPTFSIVVPTFRRPHALHESLNALLALDCRSDRYEVIVVDDGADDSTSEVVYAFRDRDVSVKLVAQLRRGAATARNRGARAAGGELLLFCDDDIVVPPDHLLGHLAAHRRDERAFVAGPWEFAPAVAQALGATPFGRYRLDLEDRYLRESRGEPLDGHPGIFQMALVSSANLSVRRDIFWEVGGFDEDFPFAGTEDQDLSLRARAAGARLLLDTRLHCFHNDQRLTLRAVCEREERGARTVPFLARKHPAVFAKAPYVEENRPIRACDPPRLVLKKLIKASLSRGPLLELLHQITHLCEAARVPERLLRRLYTTLLALHLFRGFRTTWQS